MLLLAASCAVRVHISNAPFDSTGYSGAPDCHSIKYSDVYVNIRVRHVALVRIVFAPQTSKRDDTIST